MSDSDLTSGEFPRPRHPVAPWRRRLPGVAIAFNEAEAEPELSPRDMSGAILEASLNTLWMAYQPIVDIPEQRLLGHEALLRTRQTGRAIGPQRPALSHVRRVVVFPAMASPFRCLGVPATTHPNSLVGRACMPTPTLAHIILQDRPGVNSRNDFVLLFSESVTS